MNQQAQQNQQAAPATLDDLLLAMQQQQQMLGYIAQNIAPPPVQAPAVPDANAKALLAILDRLEKLEESKNAPEPVNKKDKLYKAWQSDLKKYPGMSFKDWVEFNDMDGDNKSKQEFIPRKGRAKGVKAILLGFVEKLDCLIDDTNEQLEEYGVEPIKKPWLGDFLSQMHIGVLEKPKEYRNFLDMTDAIRRM